MIWCNFLGMLTVTAHIYIQYIIHKKPPTPQRALSFLFLNWMLPSVHIGIKNRRANAILLRRVVLRVYVFLTSKPKKQFLFRRWQNVPVSSTGLECYTCTLPTRDPCLRVKERCSKHLILRILPPLASPSSLVPVDQAAPAVCGRRESASKTLTSMTWPHVN